MKPLKKKCQIIFLVQVDDVGWADFNYNIEVNQHFENIGFKQKSTI